MYEKAEKVLDLATNGTLAIDEAKTLLSSLADIVKIRESDELEHRLQVLENAQIA